MPFFQVFSIGVRVIAMITCSALALLVFFQLHRDRAGRFFAFMALDMTFMALFGLFSRFAGILNYGDEAVRPVYGMASVFTAALPFCVFVFTIEFLGMWTAWRRWIAALLLVFGLLTSVYMLADAAFVEFHMSGEGYYVYQVYPIINIAIGVGDLGMLLAVQAVLEQSRKKTLGATNRSLLNGLLLLCFGFFLVIFPILNQYVVHVAVWTVGFVVMAVPVFQQRLFAPLKQVNNKLEHRAEQLRIITRVGQQATSFLKLHALLDVVTREIQRTFNYYAVTIFLPENSVSDALAAKAAAGVNAGEFLATGIRRAFDLTSLVGTAAVARQVVNVGHVSQDKRHAAHPLRPDTKSEITLPLIVGSAASEDTLIGVLDIQSAQADAFDVEAVEVLQILANQIAIAIHNAELFEEAQSARQKADEASRQKTAFLAQMNHELRTPLQTVLACSQWMLQHPEKHGGIALPDVYLSELRSIEASGKHLQSLINDILDLSKIEAGESQLIMALVDPLAVLHSVQETYVGSLHPGVRIVGSYPEQLPYLWGDQTKITQILGNLVGNACKFTQNGTITLDARVQDGKLQFSVSDTGSGIPSDVQDVLFRPYTPANREVVHRHGGTGLGLYVSKQLVSLHGGDIWFVSPPWQGATFYFTIPLASDDKVASERMPEPSSSRVMVFPVRSKKLPPQVLLIDLDVEKQAQEAVGLALTQVGYTVVAADRANQAVTLSTLLAPAVVITVVHPEDTTDVQGLVQQIRPEPNLKDVPFVEFPTAAMQVAAWQTGFLKQLPADSKPSSATVSSSGSSTGETMRNSTVCLSGRVLVVDTHPDTQQRLKTKLSQAGYTVSVADTITHVVLWGSFAGMQAVVIVIHPDNQAEMQSLVQVLHDDATMAAVRIITCQTSDKDWEMGICQQLSVMSDLVSVQQ